MNIVLSIIIPCYNQGHFLEEALVGLVDLKGSDFEVIVVNDGSNDGISTTTIDELVLKYSKHFTIYAIHQQNQGLAMARNNGIAGAKGKYIIPLDADNKLVVSFVGKAIKILDNDSETSIIHGNPIFFGFKDFKRQFFVKDFDLDQIIDGNYIDACCIYRKEVWNVNTGYDPKMPKMGHEDWEFWVNSHKNGFRFKYLNENAFHYRIVPNSMLTQAIPLAVDNRSYIIKKHSLFIIGYLRDKNEQLTQKYNVLKTLYLKDSQSPIRAFFKNFYRNLMGKKIDWL